MTMLGFIGLGTMGESMSENLINKSGHSVVVYDINQSQVNKMVELGAEKGTSITDIGNKSDIIFIMVPRSEHVKSVIQELLPELKEGKIVIDMSTIDVSMSKEVAGMVKETGADFLDAPVVKSKPAAISGELGIYVGGSEQSYHLVKPLLSCMGKGIIHLGENGRGISMKIAHNMLVGQIQNGVNEMLVLTEKAGIAIDDVVEAISYGGGQNFYLDSKKDTIKDQDFTPKFSFENMNKDIGLALTMAKELGIQLPGAELIKDVYAKGMESELGTEDFSASIKVVKENA